MPDSPLVGFEITSDPDRTVAGAPTRASAAVARDAERRIRLLLVADLDPQATGDAQVRAVDATSLADVLRDWSPRLDVSVADHLGDDGHRDVAWTVDAIDALTPDGLVRRVPALAAVAAARAALAEAQAGRLGLDALRARLGETGIHGADALADTVRKPPPSGTAPRAPETDAAGLDRLLGLVSLDSAPSAPPASVLDALVGAAVGPSSDIDRAAAGRAADALGGRLDAQTAAIFDHPDVRRAEGAWRGLAFLVGRLAFRRGARLDVLAASRASLAEALHTHVLLPEHAEGASRVPLVSIVVDHAFEATSADLAALTDLAETGASLQVPVVASVAPAFFGFDAPTDFARLPPAVTHLARPEYATLSSLRRRPEAASLALALPPFVLRPADGRAGPVLWGGAALLAAAAMAERHAATGWPTAPAGTTVGDLTVRQTRMGALPLAAAFSDSVLQDVARAGLLGFSGPLQTDRAVLGPPATLAGAGEASLPAAVFTALAAHRALGLGGALAGMAEDEALAEVEAHFRTFLGTSDADAVTVQAMPEHDTATSRTVGVRLRPPASIAAGAVDVVIGVTIDAEAPKEGSLAGDPAAEDPAAEDHGDV